MIISIDGFSATGKSTIAFLLAERLKLKYLNSGSIYRCIALKIMNKEFNVNDSDIYEKIVNMNIDFKIENNNQRVYLDNIDVTDFNENIKIDLFDIRKEEVSVFTPTFANNPVIKSAIREIQKKIVNEGNVVIEGRDIGTRIAPNAEYKFYLYCSLDERARRVYNERIKKEKITYEEIYNDIDKRDKKDILDGNFIKPSNAIEIDTTNSSCEEILNKMLTYIREEI